MDRVKIIQFTIYHYNIALKEPIQVGQRQLTNREGLILALVDDKDHTGFGEIAPLPGLHRETLDDCAQQSALLRKQILNQSWHNNTGIPIAPNIDWTAQKVWAPSVQFGTEAACLNLIARRKSALLAALLATKYHKYLYVNALLSGSHETIIRRAQAALSSKYPSLKLKVARGGLKEDIQLVNEIGLLIKDKAMLRLDANRRWNFKQAIHFASQISPTTIDYIEEPLKDVTQITQYFKRTHIPIALDETLGDINPKNYDIPEGTRSLVLKPSLIGTLVKIKQYHRLARRNNIDVVYSDTFHTGVGLSYSVCLAASLMTKNVPLGLDTYQWLSQDLLVNKFEAKAGKIDVVQTFQNSNNIKFSLLSKIN
jgi:O-succinylbenzoate synthase